MAINKQNRTFRLTNFHKILLSCLIMCFVLFSMPILSFAEPSVRAIVIFLVEDNSNVDTIVSEIESRPTQYGKYPGRFPEASKRKLTKSDLIGWSCPALWIMRNEIYARHGRPFSTPEVRNYFLNQSWYNPDSSYRVPADDSKRLTQLEKQNAAFILNYEKSIECEL